jgi:hypothetical protein
MIVAAHQPNYMPWTGYFYKMMLCDRFIFADDLQYTTQSYINRVRIKTAHGEKWLTVPVLSRGKGRLKIKEIRIAQSENWQHKHWRTLYLNYKHAPFFDRYAGYFEKLYQRKWTYLVDLNMEILSFIMKTLDITCSVARSSEYSVPASQINGGTEYISGESGRIYLDETDFKKKGISLNYTHFKTTRYRQQFDGFLPNLSIIDLLLNEGPASKSHLLKSGKMISTEKY